MILVIIILLGGGFMFYLSRGLEAGSQLEINNIDSIVLTDGVYRGKYSGGRWSNEVEVVIKDQGISQINLIKDVTFSKPEVTDELFARVIDKQSLDVDIVGGASVTSKAYLKAIERALSK